MLILKFCLNYGVVFFEMIIRTGATIGANATILPGIEIGKVAMIGAGAVVTRSVEAGIVVVGNPASEINE
jgi:acetyltransferase-like isoleucine patch superfamily enzyme